MLGRPLQDVRVLGGEGLDHRDAIGIRHGIERIVGVVAVLDVGELGVNMRSRQCSANTEEAFGRLFEMSGKLFRPSAFALPQTFPHPKRPPFQASS